MSRNFLLSSTSHWALMIGRASATNAQKVNDHFIASGMGGFQMLLGAALLGYYANELESMSPDGYVE